MTSVSTWRRGGFDPDDTDTHLASVEFAEDDVGTVTVGTPASDYGAVGDGVADDAAAIQAAIDSVGTGAGVPAGTVVLGAGTFRITDTLLIDQRAVRLLGSGVGNATVYNSGAGSGTTLVWGGPNDRPMLKIIDSRQCVIEQIRFEGDETSPPTAAIQLNNPGAAMIGTNAHIVLRDLHLGSWTWTHRTGNAGHVAVGVLVDGDNANNDQFLVSNVEIDSPTSAGVRIVNSQSVWNLLQHVSVRYAPIGFALAASTTARNIQTQGCDLDFEVTSAAFVWAHGLMSENCGRIARLETNGRLFISGGYGQLSSVVSPLADLTEARGNSRLVFRDFSFRQVPDPPPTIKAGGAAVSEPVYIGIEHCDRFDPDTMFEVDLAEDGDLRVVDYVDMGHRFRNVLTWGGNRTLDPNRDDG